MQLPEVNHLDDSVLQNQFYILELQYIAMECSPPKSNVTYRTRKMANILLANKLNPSKENKIKEFCAENSNVPNKQDNFSSEILD